MKTLTKEKVVIVGCGNVAWHIASHLTILKRFDISVYNHQSNITLTKFKSLLKCKTFVGMENILTEADFYFICVNDESISKVSPFIKPKQATALLMHTSGSMKLKELGERIHPTGVFYPLQTFSKDREVTWDSIPLIIEASDKNSEKKLKTVAALFSKKVFSYNYKERLKLHLSAVLVNNFANALYVSAGDVIASKDEKGNFPFDLLIPLIEETTQKVKHLDPRKAQTGPAKRNDVIVMKKHLKLLKDNSELHKLYKLMSHLIMTQQRH